MINTYILNHAELLARISDLKSEKSIREVELKNSFITLVSTLNLVSFFTGKSNKDEHRLEMVKSGVNNVIDLIIGISLGRSHSFKRYLSSLLVGKLTTSLINNNLLTIITTISSFVHRFRQKEIVDGL